MLLLVSCGLHLGRPELASSAVSPAPVVVPSAEPGLRESLSSGLDAALAARGALDPSHGQRVELTVLEASTSRLGASATGQVHLARLRVDVQLFGARPRHVVLTGERSYTVGLSSSLEASAARAAAFEVLARSLTEDAAMWILLSPGASP